MNFKEETCLSSSILGFAKFLRLQDFYVGFDASMDAIRSISEGAVYSKLQLFCALRPIFCGSFEDRERFEKLFNAYFKVRILKFKNTTKFHNQNRTNPLASVVMLGFGEQKSESEEEAKNTSGGNKEERLRRTDFSKLSTLEATELDEIAQKLWKEMSLRMKKKQKVSLSKGVIDIRKTIRSNASRGFEFVELIRKNRKPHKHKLILILDVSGSMDKYSFYLLRFMWSLKNHFRALECFVFSTQLVRVTEMMQSKDLESTLELLKMSVRVWGSGTKIGECLQVFNERYAKRIMQSKNICLILSDGLDTGNADLLALEVSKIKRKTNKLVWLNPLKGMDGYEPSQKSMKAVMDDLDVFKAANSLNSLLELENILVDV